MWIVDCEWISVKRNLRLQFCAFFFTKKKKIIERLNIYAFSLLIGVAFFVCVLTVHKYGSTKAYICFNVDMLMFNNYVYFLWVVVCCAIHSLLLLLLVGCFLLVSSLFVFKWGMFMFPKHIEIHHLKTSFKQRGVIFSSYTMLPVSWYTSFQFFIFYFILLVLVSFQISALMNQANFFTWCLILI